MNFLIREATTSDAALIADISRQSFYDTFAADNSKEDMDKFLSEQFTRGKLMLEVGRREFAFYLLYVDNVVAGYVKLRFGNVPAGLPVRSALEIARLYCMKAFIGQGVGKALMQKCIDKAREEHFEAVWLGVWERNRRAIDFYTGFGFEKFGETDFLLGNDLQCDWLMWRRV